MLNRKNQNRQIDIPFFFNFSENACHIIEDISKCAIECTIFEWLGDAGTTSLVKTQQMVNLVEK